MLRATLTTLACLCAASASPAANYFAPKKPLQPATYTHTKSLATVLESIDERLGILEELSLEQKHQSKRLGEIEKKMDLIETVMSVRLEQAELSKHYLERRLHMLQSSMQDSLQFSGDRLEQSQKRVETAAINISHALQPYTNLFKQVDEGYREVVKRSSTLEGLTRDGLALVNVTRRELADGLHGLARRQRDYRLTAKEIDTVVAEAGNNIFKRISEHTDRLDGKVQAVLGAQEKFLDTCHRIQRDERDEPRMDAQVTHLLDKLLDNIINKTNITFHKLQAIQNDIRNHDSKMSRTLVTRNFNPNEAMLKKIESAVRNATTTALKESELQKLTDKYIDLTNRADSALLLLESRLKDPKDPLEPADSDITSDADKLINKLQNINAEDGDDYDNYDDYSQEDQEVRLDEQTESWKPFTTKPSHRRHLHNHPYDRGPKRN